MAGLAEGPKIFGRSPAPSDNRQNSRVFRFFVSSLVRKNPVENGVGLDNYFIGHHKERPNNLIFRAPLGTAVSNRLHITVDYLSLTRVTSFCYKTSCSCYCAKSEVHQIQNRRKSVQFVLSSRTSVTCDATIFCNSLPHRLPPLQFFGVIPEGCKGF
jgi:hypothetical protein